MADETTLRARVPFAAGDGAGNGGHARRRLLAGLRQRLRGRLRGSRQAYRRPAPRPAFRMPSSRCPSFLGGLSSLANQTVNRTSPPGTLDKAHLTEVLGGERPWCVFRPGIATLYTTLQQVAKVAPPPAAGSVNVGSPRSGRAAATVRQSQTWRSVGSENSVAEPNQNWQRHGGTRAPKTPCRPSPIAMVVGQLASSIVKAVTGQISNSTSRRRCRRCSRRRCT
jgi:hypothetical protein